MNPHSCGFGTPTIIQNGVIVAVGTTDAVAFINPSTSVIDIQGYVISHLLSFLDLFAQSPANR
jgi:hypothetical protein